MKIGDIVEHKNKISKSGYSHNGRYVVLEYLRMKNSTTREWENAVLYRNCSTKELYVRELEDFIDKFKKV